MRFAVPATPVRLPSRDFALTEQSIGELMDLIPLDVSSINLIEGNQWNKTIISKIDGIILD